jgi:hypothetical protein
MPVAGISSAGAAAAYLVEAGRVLRVLPRLELGRRRRGTEVVITEARQRGQAQPPQSPAARARLQRVITWVDARMPRGPNCYRRALLMTALDPDAAARPLRFGLQRGGAPGSGHVWIPGRDQPPNVIYDVEFEM